MQKQALNSYEVLQLPQDATYQQIKQRYRHLSKMVHPDKHSIQNYQIAQARFKEIDEAYKSISSDLRRYIFKHYGPTGINIVENNPFLFQDFQKGDFNDPILINKLDQLMMYCLFQQYASNEIDKTSLRSTSMVMVYRPINRINQFPSIYKSNFCFETSLPDFWGMSHTASITHQSEGLSSQAKSGMIYGMQSSKRITQTLMFTANSQISHQRASMEAGVQKTINNHLILHFIPINFQNGVMGSPHIGADFHRDNYYVSGVTDFKDINIQIGSSPLNKTVSKSLKIGFDGSSLMLGPSYQRSVTSRLKLFVQLQFRTQKTQTQRPGQTASNISFGLAYGYKLKILEQLKLQLSSFISPSQSNFQISIVTPKFKATIPIFSKSDILIFELYKLGTFIGIYLSYELYNYYMRKSQKRRKRIQYNNYNRLSVEKIAVAKSNSDSSITADESKETEIKYFGLIILFAYAGSSSSIRRVKKTIKQAININKQDYKVEQILRISQQLQNTIKTNDDDFKNELYDLRESVQTKVKGSQLFQFNIEELRVNPCMDQEQPYKVLVVYYSRGKIGIVEKPKNKVIRIGKMRDRYNTPWYSSILNYFKNKMIN